MTLLMYIPLANAYSQVSDAETESKLAQAKKYYAENPEDGMAAYGMYTAQYAHSKYVRRDNQPKAAKELGYLDAQELYPDFKPRAFREFLGDLLDGKIVKPYAGGLA